MKQWQIVLISGVFVAAAGAEEPPSKWSVSAGVVHRFGMNLEVSGSSHSQNRGGLTPSDSFRQQTVEGSLPADDITQFANRSFDDGYVFMDAGTVNYGGDTWYWGYDNSSQVQDDTLVFHRSVLETTTTLEQSSSVGTLYNRDWREDVDLNATGAEIQLSRFLLQKKDIRINWSVGVQILPDFGKSLRTSTLAQRETTTFTTTISEQQLTQTTTYDLMGVDPPDAPYRGTESGWPPPSPLLPNLPSDQTVSSSGESVSSETERRSVAAWNDNSMDIDLDLYSVWTGPQIQLDVSGKAALFLQPALSVNYVGMEAARRETWWVDSGSGAVAAARWHDRAEKGAWRLGLGILAGLEVPFGDHWFATVSGGYEWVPDPVDLAVGPNKVSLDLSGGQLKGGIGCRW